MVVDDAFWQGRRVFVTGHTGFKGSWLALCLRRLGSEVTGYALAPPTSPSLFEEARVAAGLRDIRGDVRDLDALRHALEGAAPDVVVHMAAQSLVRPSYADPVETYSTNVMGTVNLLEAVRTAGSVRATLVVTSDKCYEDRDGVRAHGEDDPMGGFDPYSSSKGCAELVTAAYRASYPGVGRAVASARAGNVIGGGDWAVDRLVPDAMKAFAAGEPVEIRRPDATRPWQFVLEPLTGYLRLAEELCARGQEMASGWNFGPDEQEVRPVAEVVGQLARLWGEGARWRLAAGEHPREAGRLALDCSKARARLEWAPRLCLDEALEWTVDWYRSRHAGADVARLTEAQVARYFEAAK